MTITIKPVRRVRYWKHLASKSYGYRWEPCVPCQSFRGKREYEWQWGLVDSNGKVLDKRENKHDAERLLTGRGPLHQLTIRDK